MRLIDADALMQCIPAEEIVSRMIVASATTIEPDCKWIPVSERLPEESDDYLCSYGALTWHFVGIDIYDADKKEFGFYSDDEQGNEVWHHVKNVVAWMPLPAPYKED